MSGHYSIDGLYSGVAAKGGSTVHVWFAASSQASSIMNGMLLVLVFLIHALNLFLPGKNFPLSGGGDFLRAEVGMTLKSSSSRGWYMNYS